MKRLVSGLPLLFTAATLLAQDDNTATATPEELSQKAAVGIVAGACGVIVVSALIYIAIWLWIAIWVMKDAKRRQSPNATLVTVLAWIPPTTVIGLIIHLVTRPKTIPGAPNP
jgi:protein-S-isoprenylcysteine O-methyltransferase Ste14